MDKDQIQVILNEMESGYDLVSEKFSQTRSHFWRDIEYVKKYTKNGDRVLDFGCGNGRLLELIGDKNIQHNGVDISEKLIEIARKKYQGLNIDFQKISSFPSLPFEDNFFNVVYAIAVFHHFPGQDYQSQWAKELYRVTKQRGKIIITVWNLWQKKYIAFIFQNWLRKIISKSQLDWNDIYIPFTDNNGKVFQRYHHVFTCGGLTRTFQAAGFRIYNCRRVGRNLVLIVEKKTLD